MALECLLVNDKCTAVVITADLPGPGYLSFSEVDARVLTVVLSSPQLWSTTAAVAPWPCQVVTEVALALDMAQEMTFAWRAAVAVDLAAGLVAVALVVAAALAVAPGVVLASVVEVSAQATVEVAVPASLSPPGSTVNKELANIPATPENLSSSAPPTNLKRAVSWGWKAGSLWLFHQIPGGAHVKITSVRLPGASLCL